MITRIRFDPDELASRGLKTEELRDLGPLVVLAGPNGGGKTRHLDLVRSALVSHPVGALQQEIDDTTAGESLRAALIRYEPATPLVNPELVSPRDFDAKLNEILLTRQSAHYLGKIVLLDEPQRLLLRVRTILSPISSSPSLWTGSEAATMFECSRSALVAVDWCLRSPRCCGPILRSGLSS